MRFKNEHSPSNPGYFSLIKFHCYKQQHIIMPCQGEERKRKGEEEKEVRKWKEWGGGKRSKKLKTIPPNDTMASISI